MTTDNFTREWYMENSSERHHTYYLAVAARSSITTRLFPSAMLEKIKKSKDPHMNDVPLKEWDIIAKSIRAIEIYENGKRVYSLSSGVCALKAIAKQWKTDNNG